MPKPAPTKEGFYLARMKTWAVYDGPAFVKVTRVDSRTFQVWQCADTRPWPVDAWDWHSGPIDMVEAVRLLAGE